MDAGTYYLKETKAPAGYIKSTDVYKIEINATYTQIPGGTYTNDDNILVKYDAYEVLDSYSVREISAYICALVLQGILLFSISVYTAQFKKAQPCSYI